MTIFTDEQALERKRAKREGDRQRQREIEKAEAVRMLYQSPAGRTYLLWTLEVAKAIGHSPYRGDPYLTAFVCGENNVGLQLMAQMIRTDASAFADLLKENDRNARSYAVTKSEPGPDTAAESDSEPEPESKPEPVTYT